MENLRELRIDLARRSKWNVGFFWSGLALWIFILVTGNLYPLSTAKFAWLVGGFFVVPLAIPISKLFEAEPFPKNNTLADLAGKTHGSVTTLGFPIVLISLIFFPEGQILVMAILYCLDFYVFGWVFGSGIFITGASIRIVGATAIWFFLPEFRLTLLPAFVALTYLVFAITIPIQRQKWEEQNLGANGA